MNILNKLQKLHYGGSPEGFVDGFAGEAGNKKNSGLASC
jgi:hypothetical protein